MNVSLSIETKMGVTPEVRAAAISAFCVTIKAPVPTHRTMLSGQLVLVWTAVPGVIADEVWTSNRTRFAEALRGFGAVLLGEPIAQGIDLGLRRSVPRGTRLAPDWDGVWPEKQENVVDEATETGTRSSA